MKVLIIELSNLGDAILTYPALSALWAAYPGAEFHLLASGRTRELFQGEPRIHRVWAWESQAPPWIQLALVARLAGLGFSRVVDFRNSIIPLFIWGARRTPILRGPSPDGIHRADLHLRLVASLGVPPAPAAVRLPFGPQEDAQVSRWLEPGRRTVAIVPGARSHLKRWGAERFAEVADRLIEERQAQVLLVGEEAERPIAGDVRRAMRHQPTDLVGRTTIRQLAALLARTELVITGDTACLHAAEVMGVPAVAIFGPTDERKYGPRDPRSAVVRRALVCAPCERALCPYGHECMRWLPAEEVVQAAVRILPAVPGTAVPGTVP